MLCGVSRAHAFRLVVASLAQCSTVRNMSHVKCRSPNEYKYFNKDGQQQR